MSLSQTLLPFPLDFSILGFGLHSLSAKSSQSHSYSIKLTFLHYCVVLCFQQCFIEVSILRQILHQFLIFLPRDLIILESFVCKSSCCNDSCLNSFVKLRNRNWSILVYLWPCISMEQGKWLGNVLWLEKKPVLLIFDRVKRLQLNSNSRGNHSRSFIPFIIQRPPNIEKYGGKYGV